MTRARNPRLTHERALRTIRLVLGGDDEVQGRTGKTRSCGLLRRQSRYARGARAVCPWLVVPAMAGCGRIGYGPASDRDRDASASSDAGRDAGRADADLDARSSTDADLDAWSSTDADLDAWSSPDADLDARSSTDASLDATAGALMRTVELSGGTGWEGWERVGEACGPFWTLGDSDREYTFYRARFRLDPAQTVTARRLPDGAVGNGVDVAGTTADLFADDWRAGDRMVGVGIEYAGSTRLSGTFFVHVDYDGNSMQPASSCGALDGVRTFDRGDSSSYFSSARWFRALHYAVFSDFSALGGDNFRYGFLGPGPPLGPLRSFVVLATGSRDVAISGQFLLNLDAAARLGGGAGTGEGTCSASTRLGFAESDLAGGVSQQSFPLGGCF